MGRLLRLSYPPRDWFDRIPQCQTLRRPPALLQLLGVSSPTNSGSMFRSTMCVRVQWLLFDLRNHRLGNSQHSISDFRSRSVLVWYVPIFRVRWCQGWFRYLGAALAMSQCIPVDHHTQLGVSRNADIAEIRQAFREKARFWHPDKNASPEAAEQFRLVRVSFEALTSEGSTGPATSSTQEAARRCEVWFCQTYD